MNCSRCGLGGLKQVEGSGHHDPISRQTAFGVPGPGITPGKDMAPNTGSRARGRGLRPKSARPDLDRHRDGRRPLTRHFDRNSETLAEFDLYPSPTGPRRATRAGVLGPAVTAAVTDRTSIVVLGNGHPGQGRDQGQSRRTRLFTTNPSYVRFIESFFFSNNHW